MIQLAFAGHNRANDLGHHEPVTEGLDAAFRLIREAGVERARLLTGLAPGADELAAEAWRLAQLGPIHAVFPFLDDPEAKAAELRGVQSATWLDGAAAEVLGRNPHLKQTRLVVEAADLLVVVWTGERARGAGGTADAVRCALETGLSVLWVKPSDSPRLRLIRPEKLPSDFDFLEFQEGLGAGNLSHVEEATETNVREALNLEALTAAEAADALDRQARAAGDKSTKLDAWLHGWLWKTYGAFRTLMGGRVSGMAAPHPVPEDLAEQGGFQLLTAAYMSADQHANRLSAVHRSEQILLLLAMVTAAIVGSAWTIWPGFKITAVFIELMLGLAALWVWSSAARARQHERWGEERHLAEQLRLIRACWPLGVSLVSTRTPPIVRQALEPEQAILRKAGLPHGEFDEARVASWGRWALSELVEGQAAYHLAVSKREGRIAHRIHVAENAAFVFLLALFASYLVAHALSHPLGLHVPHWISGVVAMAGTVVPAFAAATMALEAKLEFKEQSARSARIGERLQGLAAQLGPSPSLDDLQGAARAAMRWHLAETSHWRDGAGRRQLFRP
ncbi:MAG: hypothetical protein V4759_08665 [Pseudomonadota bacterium]